VSFVEIEGRVLWVFVVVGGLGRSGGERMLLMTTESTNEEQQKSMNDWFDPAHYVDVETHTCQDDTDS